MPEAAAHRSPPPPPWREVLRIALPAALGLLSYAVMQAIDCALLGRYDTVDQAGAGITFILVWAAMCPILGTMSGIATFSAQYTGAGRFRRAGRHLRSVLLLAVSASVPYVFLSLLASDIVKLIAPSLPPPVASAGGTYLGIRLLGMAFVAVGMGTSSFLRGTGDAVTPLKVSVAANVLNFVLDYILIFGRLGLPALGVRGAAIATVTAQAFEASCFLYLIFSNGGLRRDFRIGFKGRVHWVEVRRLIRVGGPIGAYWTSEAGAWAAFMALFGAYGNEAVVAANYAAFQLMHFSFLPVVGLLIAAQALVGKYVGARSPVEARRRAFLSMRMGVAFMSFAALIMLLFRYPLIGLFTTSDEVVAVGAGMMIFVAILQPFDAMSMTAIGSLRGAGDTVFAFWIMTGAAWLVFVPSTFLIVKVLHAAPAFAWLGAILFMILLASITFARLRSRAWESKRV